MDGGQVQEEAPSQPAAPFGDPSRLNAVRRRKVLELLGLTSLGFLTAPAAIAAPDRFKKVTGGVVRSALHIHSSFSEGRTSLSSLKSGSSTVASMESQVAVLAAVGADLCFFTDHDHLMGFEKPGRNPVRLPGVEDLRAPHWTYRPETDGTPNGGSVALTRSGLEASVTSGASGAWRFMFVDCGPTQRDYRASMAGLFMGITLQPQTSTGWTEMRLWGSVRPITRGRPTGTYQVHYRFTPSAKVRSVHATGLIAVVTIPVNAAVSQHLTVSPVDDLRAAFPDLGERAQDNGLYGVWLGVGAPAGESARSLITSLTLDRRLTGPQAIALQQNLIREIAPLYPSISIGSGLEFSYLTHINWFSPDPDLLQFLPPGGASAAAYLLSLVNTVHSRGGAASYNHPFGAAIGPALTGSARTQLVTKTARVLLGNSLYGADVLEVGYEMRGHATVATHLSLWDILLSAGLRVMADGVSDDHAGTMQSTVGGTNHYFTDVISGTNDPAVIVPLLALGRSFVSLRTGFSGMLDLACGETLMGGTHTARGSGVDVQITADGVSSGGNVRVLQMVVHGDRTRAAVTPPLWQQTLPAAQFARRPLSFRVANVRSYLRCEVRDAAGRIVAFSNPLFLRP